MATREYRRHVRYVPSEGTKGLIGLKGGSDVTTSEGTYLDKDNQRCKGWAACYMDDLIVFSNSAEDHQKHLTILLEVLS